MNQGGPIDHFFGLEYQVGVIKEAKVLKAPDTAKKIEMRGILRDIDVIEVRSEGHISTGNGNLSISHYIPVTKEV